MMGDPSWLKKYTALTAEGDIEELRIKSGKIPPCTNKECVFWAEDFFEHKSVVDACTTCSRFYKDKFRQSIV